MLTIASRQLFSVLFCFTSSTLLSFRFSLKIPPHWKVSRRLSLQSHICGLSGECHRLPICLKLRKSTFQLVDSIVQGLLYLLYHPDVHTLAHTLLQTDPRIEITVVDQQQNRLLFAVKSRYPSLRTIIEYLSSKVIEDAALSLSITRDDGGYQFLYVISGTSKDDARLFFYGHNE